MSWPLGWLRWAAAWTLVAQAQVWVWVGLDVLHERRTPTLDATPVDAGVATAALVLAVMAPLSAVLAVLPRTRRVGLLLGSPVLATAAWAWTGFADGDVGGWYVGLSAAAAVAALLAGAIGVSRVDGTDGDGSDGAGSDGAGSDGAGSDRAASVLAGLALAAAGTYLVWTSLRGGAYWQWVGSERLVHGAGVAVGITLVLAGATGTWWHDLRSRGWRLGATSLLGLLALVLLLGAHHHFSSRGGMLYRWVENESPWGFGMPALLAGTGLLAGAVAGLRRRGDLMALSVAAGVGCGLLALWQEPTWGRLMS